MNSGNEEVGGIVKADHVQPHKSQYQSPLQKEATWPLISSASTLIRLPTGPVMMFFLVLISIIRFNTKRQDMASEVGLLTTWEDVAFCLQVGLETIITYPYQRPGRPRQSALV
nr:hypothetical protein [Tanacetum cinerariifolium]